MSELPKLLILDVGHGSCTILIDTEGVLVIDCPRGSVVPNTLAMFGISEIKALILSHSDADHVSGVIGLLEDSRLHVRTVYLNPDAYKQSKLWRELRAILNRVSSPRFSKRTIVDSNLNSNREVPITCGEVSIEILAPGIGLSLGGAGSTDLLGNPLSSNSLSVVVRLVHKSHPVALITSDMDETCYRNLIQGLNNIGDIKADLLIFPHHGGHTNSPDETLFAIELSQRVEPNKVFFSIGRGRYGTPREEIIRGIRLGRPSAHILCTQLSTNCSSSVVNRTSHLISLPSQGRTENKCCAGSLIVHVNGGQSTYDPDTNHRNFINTHFATTGLCVK